jgi:hypothetical protein
MSVKVSVICTGQLRDPFEFGIIISRLMQFKEQGLIDQLILSSWKNDLIASSEVLTALRQAGFQVVLSDVPTTAGPGFCWGQKRQLAAGLQHVEPGSVVAKVRTDKCAHLIERIVRHANQRRKTIRNEPEAGSFKRRVSVTNVVANWALSHSDFTFVGLREDLLRMTTCDATDSAWVGPGPVAEVEWYHAALRGQDPVTDQWMRHLDAGLLARSLTKLEPGAIDRDALAAIWPIFARVWTLTMGNYQVLSSAPLDDQPLPKDLPLSLLNGRQDMAAQNGLSLIGPKVKVNNAAMAYVLSRHPTILEGTERMPDPTQVIEAIKLLFGPLANKIMIGELPTNHLPLAGVAGTLHEVLLKSVFGTGAAAVEQAFPDPVALNKLAQGRDPDNALMAEATRISQEGATSGDEIQQRAAAEVLAMLTYKRHAPALPALLATPGVGTHIETARMRAVLQRASSFEPRVWDLVKEKAVHDPSFAKLIEQKA